jgi:hypothetical protein
MHDTEHVNMTGTDTGGGPRELVERSAAVWLALVALVATALLGGLWLLGVVIGPSSQPYCGAPNVDDSCAVSPSYWLWALPPLTILGMSILALGFVLRRSRPPRPTTR